MVTCEIQEYKNCFYCQNSWNPKYTWNLVSKSDKMEPFGRSELSWEDNIKINHTQIRCEDGEWTVCHYSSDPSKWGRRHQFFPHTHQNQILWLANLHANEELGYSNSVVDRRLLWIKFKPCIQLHGLCILISNNLTTLDLNVKKAAWNKLHYSSSLVTSCFVLYRHPQNCLLIALPRQS